MIKYPQKNSYAGRKHEYRKNRIFRVWCGNNISTILWWFNSKIKAIQSNNKKDGVEQASRYGITYNNALVYYKNWVNKHMKNQWLSVGLNIDPHGIKIGFGYAFFILLHSFCLLYAPFYCSFASENSLRFLRLFFFMFFWDFMFGWLILIFMVK